MERFYPFEHKDEKKSTGFSERESSVRNEGREEASAYGKGSREEANAQGKGRRGGNAGLSKVIHSGKVTERAVNYRQREGRFIASELSDGSVLWLKVAQKSEYGVFLEAEVDGEVKKILLPFSEQVGRPEVGTKVKVMLYEDKGGRITATMHEPFLNPGDTGLLKCAAVTKIGAFADNGTPKQVLVPFKEMTHTPNPGDELLLHLYKDKSGRTAATMRIYKFLEKAEHLNEGDIVEGFVYEINPEIGIFVAIADRYYGMIPAQENFEELKYGDRISARVAKIRPDGKIDLLMREKLFMSADADADKIVAELKANGGVLPYADRAEAEFIKTKYHMSKNQFKRALGYLYKKRLVKIDRDADTVTLIANL
ncbi:MAG: S1-like domain-containing RNA-binding protein [Eubacteriales bacterium]|nr:S1-like domain-containing RNA-binding protein [Eubacteriales bacterium]